MNLLLFFIPNIAFASGFETLMNNFYREIFNPAIKVILALAIVYFFYGVFVFLSNMDSDEKKTTGKKHMLYGIIGIFVMVSVWGIIGILLRTFNIEGIKIDGSSSSSSGSNQGGNTTGGGITPGFTDGNEDFEYAPPPEFGDLDFKNIEDGMIPPM